MFARDWMAIPDLCAYLGISKETVYRLIKANKIPVHKLGKLYRFNRVEIDKWMKKK